MTQLPSTKSLEPPLNIMQVYISDKYIFCKYIIPNNLISMITIRENLEAISYDKQLIILDTN